MGHRYAELEILISAGSRGYEVEARRRMPTGDVITPRTALDLAPANPAFRDADPQICGRALAATLFAPADVRDAFVAAQTAAQEAAVDLRLRLRVSVDATELHVLPWETLYDPAGQAPLCVSQRCFFSRYLFSREMRLPRLRPRSSVSALVAVANPAGLADDLAAIDAMAEAERIGAALAPIPVVTLAERGQATMERMFAALRDGVEVFYLVCHGAMIDDEPMLWLERADGSRDLVAGRMLVNRIGMLERPPSLVVLCSCQSAGAGPARGGDMMKALGPLLAQAGVPAVLAMQGNVGMDSMGTFMPLFFAELREHGEVDRAAGVARAAIAAQPDWWMPAVFTRLESARIFYPPGFGGSGVPESGDDPWRAVMDNIRHGETTPILGPGVGEPLFGSRLQMAQTWAETFHFPMAAHERDELPQVAQYLSASQQPVTPRRLFYRFLYQQLCEQYREAIPPPLLGLPEEDIVAQLGEVIAAVAGVRLAVPDDPHRVLAELRLPVYITTDPSDLLVHALQARDPEVKPFVRLCRWNAAAETCDDALTVDHRDARPSARTPMVFKMFGDLREPRSLVLTEDQYFDYLISVSKNLDAIIPLQIRARLNDSALLIIGFDVQSWDFRVLFRTILNQEGADLRSEYLHMSAQLDPNSILDPVSARRYLERYFQDKARMKLYWGDVAMFVAELQRRLRP